MIVSSRLCTLNDLKCCINLHSSYTVFFFGFTQNEYTYDERRDEGVQFIPFRAAPGNVTEKMFTFRLNLNSISATFTFGGMLLQSVKH